MKAMRDNFCIFKRITHRQSGEELEIPYLNMGNMFETLDLDGPGIILEFRDPEEYIRSQMKIKERDENLLLNQPLIYLKR